MSPDVHLAAMCVCSAFIRFFHPQMIAECATKPGPTIDQMIDFIIAAMSPGGNANQLTYAVIWPVIASNSAIPCRAWVACRSLSQ